MKNSSQWRKWLTQPGLIRVVTLDATDVVHALIVQQGLRGRAQVGYAEAVAGALLIASSHKSNESINLNARGSGAYRQAMIDASPEGRVRGFLVEPEGDPPDPKTGSWGRGVLSVLYTQNQEGKTPYRGMVAIETGFLDDAINQYYRDSAQLVSLAGLSVEFDGERVIFARGALVQALGGATAEELERIHAMSVEDLRFLASLADNQEVTQQEISRLLGGADLALVETQKLTSFCSCSQERIERALMLTGERDVLEALGDDPAMTITCDFCRTEYRLSADRVRSLFVRDPSHLQ